MDFLEDVNIDGILSATSVNGFIGLSNTDGDFLADGTADSGILNYAARADHVHPGSSGDLSTAVLLAGRVGGQVVTGSTDTTTGLTLKGTSANGVATDSGIKALVGNNGSITAFNILNSGWIGIGIDNPDALVSIKKTGAPLWILDSALKTLFEITPAAANIGAGLFGNIKNIGSATGTTGHCVGVFGWAEDTADGKHDLYGVEGRVQGLGSAGKFYGSLGLVVWEGATFTNRQAYGVTGRVEITTDGSTPLAQGIVAAFYAPEIIGGATYTKYSLFGKDVLRVDNYIVSNDVSGTYNTTIFHDGTYGFLSSDTPLIITTTTANSIYFSPNGTIRATILNGGNFGILTTSPSVAFDINSNIMRLRTAKTPASSTDTLATGSIFWDASYLYITTSTNVTKRVALTSF